MTLKEAKKRIQELEARLETLEKGVQIHVNHWHHQVQPINPHPVKFDPFPVTCFADKSLSVSHSSNGVQCGAGAIVGSALS